MRLILLFLFLTIPYIGKSQKLPVVRTNIMRPVVPPRKTAVRFTDDIGKTIVVTKHIPGLDYNVYSRRLVNAANQGNVKAQFALWYLFYHGQSVDVNDGIAVKYLKMAARKGHATALNQLGICYLDGIGVLADEKLAAKYFEQSASKGNMNAQTNLAWCYLNGIGIIKNRSKAMQLYKIAADKGDVRAQCSMGIAYEIGEDLPYNRAESMKYLHLAANQGDGQAQYELATSYLQEGDKNGVPIRNRMKAFDFFKKSADNGFIRLYRYYPWMRGMTAS